MDPYPEQKCRIRPWVLDPCTGRSRYPQVRNFGMRSVSIVIFEAFHVLTLRWLHSAVDHLKVGPISCVLTDGPCAKRGELAAQHDPGWRRRCHPRHGQEISCRLQAPQGLFKAHLYHPQLRILCKLREDFSRGEGGLLIILSGEKQKWGKKKRKCSLK